MKKKKINSNDDYKKTGNFKNPKDVDFNYNRITLRMAICGITQMFPWQIYSTGSIESVIGYLI